MLELSEDTEVHTVWFVGWSNGDLLACVFRQKGQPWEGRYRFRYHTAPKVGDPFLEDDKKSAHAFRANDLSVTPERLVAGFEMICRLTADQYNAAVFDQMEINGSGLDAIRMMRSRPWCHIQEVQADAN